MIACDSFVILNRDEDATPPEGLRVIRLVPSYEPGHGTDPNTLDALDWLAARVKVGMRVLDVGTGVGTLAIAAALLGADVTATELRPEGAARARENARLNGVTIDVRETTTGGIPFGKFDLIVANLGNDAAIGEMATMLQTALYASGEIWTG